MTKYVVKCKLSSLMNLDLGSFSPNKWDPDLAKRELEATSIEIDTQPASGVINQLFNSHRFLDLVAAN